MKNFTRLSLAVIAAMGLSACGGGGGGGGNPEPNPNPDPNPGDDEEVVLNIRVLDGYVRGAQVYADLDRDFEWNKLLEPRHITNADGITQLKIPKALLRDESGNVATHVRVVALGHLGARDYIYGQETKVGGAMVFAGEVYFNSDPNYVHVITPFTTLAAVAAGADAAAMPESQYSSDMARIADAAGVTAATLTGDYNAVLNDENLKAMVTSEYLGRNGQIPATEAELKALAADPSVTLDSLVSERITANRSGIDEVYKGIQDATPEGEDISPETVVSFITGNPVTPDKPDNPDNPDNPDKPDNPDNPDKPDNPDNPDNPDVPSYAAKLAVQVISGYPKGASACLDLDMDGTCTRSEPLAGVDATGHAVFELDEEQAKAVKEAKAIKVMAMLKKDDPDTVLGVSGKLRQDMLLTATLFAPEIYGSASDGPVTNCTADVAANCIPVIPEYRVTVFTTFADATIAQDGAITAEEYESRLDAVADKLGLDRKVIRSDFNNPDTADTAAIMATAASELMGGMGFAPAAGNDPLARLVMTQDTAMAALDDVSENLKVLTAAVANDPEMTPENAVGAIQFAGEYLRTNFSDLTSGKGEDFRCAATRIGDVYCWGSNAWGNLGDPEKFRDASGEFHRDGSAVTDLFSYEPVQVKLADGTPLSGVKQVESGRNFACGVTEDGGVYCWGDNYYGQIGTGVISQDKRYVPAATRVVAGTQDKEGYLSGIKSISLGRNSACALSYDGTAFCWGDNTVMELGDDYADLDVTEPYASLTASDGKSFPEGFRVKAVPYPVKLALPDDLRMTNIVAGEWMYCALADTSKSDDKHNLYCWGNDSRSLFYGLYNHFSYDEDGFLTPEFREAQKVYGKLEYFWDLQNASGEDGDFLNPDDPWVCTDEKDNSVTAEYVNKLAKQKVPDSNHEFYSWDRYNRMGGRDWLIIDSNGDYHPMFASALKRIDAFYEPFVTSVSEEDYAVYHDKNGYRELLEVTDIAFGSPSNTNGETFEEYDLVSDNNVKNYRPGRPDDSFMIVGLRTDENGGKYKRWYALRNGSRTVKGEHTYTCSYTPPYSDCPHSDDYCRAEKVYDHGHDVYALTGKQLFNNGGRSVGENAVYLGETGLPELMRCTYSTKKGHVYNEECAEGIDRIVEDITYTENDSVLKVSKNPDSTCTLSRDPEDEGGIATVLSCTGGNMFGQTGAETTASEISVNGSEPQKYEYDGLSYAAYTDLWKYSLPRHIFTFNEEQEIDEDAVHQEVVSYLEGFNTGVAWAGLSCGDITTDTPSRVDQSNETSCGGVHGNELRNSALENSLLVDHNAIIRVPALK